MNYASTSDYQLISALMARSIKKEVLTNLAHRDENKELHDAAHEIHEELNDYFELHRTEHAKAYLIVELMRLVEKVREVS